MLLWTSWSWCMYLCISDTFLKKNLLSWRLWSFQRLLIHAVNCSLDTDGASTHVHFTASQCVSGSFWYFKILAYLLVKQIIIPLFLKLFTFRLPNSWNNFGCVLSSFLISSVLKIVSCVHVMIRAFIFNFLIYNKVWFINYYFYTRCCLVSYS